jgi:aspartyl/glutamyl-tRNA(Asn/Gln) amidotransferase C subunit
MSDKKLTPDDIKHLGKLANLPLSDDEIEKLQNQLTETIAYVENLKELNTDNVEETHQTTNLENIYFEDGTPSTRTLTQEEAVGLEKEHKGGCFVVKRIMHDE